MLANSTAALEYLELSPEQCAQLIVNVHTMLTATHLRPTHVQTATLINHALPLIEHEEISSKLELDVMQQTLLAHGRSLQPNEARQFIERYINIIRFLEMSSSQRLEQAHRLMAILRNHPISLSKEYNERLVDTILETPFDDKIPPEQLKQMIDGLLRARAKSVLNLDCDQDQALRSLATSVVADPEASLAIRRELAQTALHPENWHSTSILKTDGFLGGMARLLMDSAVPLREKQAMTEALLSAVLDDRMALDTIYQIELPDLALQVMTSCDREKVCCAKLCELLFQAEADCKVGMTSRENKMLAQITKRQIEDFALSEATQLLLTIQFAHALRTENMDLSPSERRQFTDRCLDVAHSGHYFSEDQATFTQMLLDDVADTSIRLTQRQQRKLAAIAISHASSPRVPEANQRTIADTVLYAAADGGLMLEAHEYRLLRRLGTGQPAKLDDATTKHL